MVVSLERSLTHARPLPRANLIHRGQSRHQCVDERREDDFGLRLELRGELLEKERKSTRASRRESGKAEGPEWERCGAVI